MDLDPFVGIRIFHEYLIANNILLLISFITGLISIIVAVYFYIYVSKQKVGTSKMKEISDAIKEGAIAFLKRQYTTLIVFVIILTVILYFFIGPETSIAYVIGSLCSAFAGFLGMDIALKANVRTANAARRGLKRAFPIGFYGGAVTGLAIVGLAVAGLSAVYYFFPDPEIVLGFSFGASLVALFAKAGGGIYTKTADIGADLVGKVEMNIPEDDPRNPAVIADNVGDNVGDVAGMGADLFDSYVASVVAAMIIGAVTMELGALLPLVFSAAGIIASVIGTFFVKAKKKGSPGKALNNGTYITCFLFALFSFLIVYLLALDMGIFYAIISGLVAGIVIGITSDYYTSIDRTPALRTAEVSKTGAAINILTGFSYGSISILPPLIGIGVATVISYHFAGIFGIAMSAIGMLSITGMIVSADAYGPIVDNAKGIAEQSRLGKKVIQIADKLDAAGNTAKAITKGFAIGAAGISVIALLVAYTEIVGIKTIDIMNPFVLAGALIGIAIPPLFSALTILGVGKNAFRMINEVRRQFKEIPGLIKGKTKPDYAKCVDIATKGALKELILPSVLAVIVPLIVGFVLGVEALGGFLAGSILSGLIFALFMANSGGLWDNAKKYIEEGNFGGKGSDAHKAAVIGDTVGDPFKDTAGPSLDTLLVVMSLVASLFAPLIVKYALIR
ncbi:MAG: sodium-translocating pyrophosphatase [Candidatus Aenigmarchaeota archaeon]|nr:sodium-translocating pyrophosphatase [Candidatus Aenigmarchaeota archaeon]